MFEIQPIYWLVAACDSIRPMTMHVNYEARYLTPSELLLNLISLLLLTLLN